MCDSGVNGPLTTPALDPLRELSILGKTEPFQVSLGD